MRLKESVIGAGCVLGKGCKINNSIIMDGACVGELCVVQNSIICSNSELEASVNINDCQVVAGARVAAQGKHKRKVLR